MSTFAATVECLEANSALAATTAAAAAESISTCCITDYVTVPSAEHVSEIVGRKGYKIKSLRARTNTYIKTPHRYSQPVFVISGTAWDVESAKSHIVRDSLHFSAIQQKRCEESGEPALSLAAAPLISFDDSPTTSGEVQILPNSGHNVQRSSSSDQMWPQVASEGPKSFLQCSSSSAAAAASKSESEVDVRKFVCCATAPKSLVPNNAAALAANQKGYNLHEFIVDSNRHLGLMSGESAANCGSMQFRTCDENEPQQQPQQPIQHQHHHHHHTTCHNNNVLYSSCHLRVPYNIVGLLVGPKGITIKEIQSLSGCYIITPNRNRDPIFEIFGFPANIKLVLGLIHSFLDMNLSVAERDSIRHIEVLSNYPLVSSSSSSSSDLYQRSGGDLQLATVASRPTVAATNSSSSSSLSLNDLALHGHLRQNNNSSSSSCSLSLNDLALHGHLRHNNNSNSSKNIEQSGGAAIGTKFLQNKAQLDNDLRILQQSQLGRREETKKHQETCSVNFDSFPSNCGDDLEDYYEDDEDHLIVDSLRSMIQSIGIFEEKG